MSYTEYLRRKQAGQPVILNNQKLRSASELTQQRRMLAASVFRLDGSGEGTTRGDLSLTGTSVNQKQPTSFMKRSGRPASASDFTSYVGSYAIQNDNVFPNASKVTNDAACTLNTDAKIAEPTPYITGSTNTITATRVPRSASDFIRERIACQESQGERHIQNELGPSVFVDDTIRKPEYNKQYLSGATSCTPDLSFPAANHQHPVTNPRADYQARNAKSQIPVFNVPSQDRVPAMVTSLPNCFTGQNTTGKYNTGGVLPKDALRYVEKHHGNDLFTMVNGRKPVPKKYQIPYGTPAQLKINDPIGPHTPNM